MSTESENKFQQEWIELACEFRTKLTQGFIYLLEKIAKLSFELNPAFAQQSQEHLLEALKALENNESVFLFFIPHKGSMDAQVVYNIINQWFSPYFFAFFSSIKFEQLDPKFRGGVKHKLGGVTKLGLIELIVRALFSLDPRSQRFPVYQGYLLKDMDRAEKLKALRFNRKQRDRFEKEVTKHPLVIGISPEGTRSKTGLQRAVSGSFGFANNDQTLILPTILQSTGFKSDSELLKTNQHSKFEVIFDHPLRWSDVSQLSLNYCFTKQAEERSKKQKNQISAGEKLTAEDMIMWWTAWFLPNTGRGVYAVGCIEKC